LVAPASQTSQDPQTLSVRQALQLLQFPRRCRRLQQVAGRLAHQPAQMSKELPGRQGPTRKRIELAGELT
jgi:hypothetical protein